MISHLIFVACKFYALNITYWYLNVHDDRIISTGWFGLSVLVYHALSGNNIYVSSPSENWQMDWLTVRQASLSIAVYHNMNLTRPVTTVGLFIVTTTQYFALSHFYVWLPSKNCLNKRLLNVFITFRVGLGYVKTQLSCILFIMQTTTCLGHCGPSSGHKNVYTVKLYSVRSQYRCIL